MKKSGIVSLSLAGALVASLCFFAPVTARGGVTEESKFAQIQEANKAEDADVVKVAGELEKEMINLNGQIATLTNAKEIDLKEIENAKADIVEGETIESVAKAAEELQKEAVQFSKKVEAIKQKYDEDIKRIKSNKEKVEKALEVFTSDKNNKNYLDDQENLKVLYEEAINDLKKKIDNESNDKRKAKYEQHLKKINDEKGKFEAVVEQVETFKKDIETRKKKIEDKEKEKKEELKKERETSTEEKNSLADKALTLTKKAIHLKNKVVKEVEEKKAAEEAAKKAEEEAAKKAVEEAAANAGIVAPIVILPTEEVVNVTEETTPLGEAVITEPEKKAEETPVTEEVVEEGNEEEVEIEEETTARGEAIIKDEVEKKAISSLKGKNKAEFAEKDGVKNVLAKTGGMDVSLFALLSKLMILFVGLFTVTKFVRK